MKKSSEKTSVHASLLRDRGLKATPARVAVLSLFSVNAKPLSIQNILDQIKSASADQATIYRITEAFKTAGLIREVNLEHGHAHFELNTKEHHHHIVCERCGKVVDISNCDLDQLQKEVLKKSGFHTIHRHSLEFFGICQQCQNKK